MTEEKPPLKPPTVNEVWKDTWFFLSLFAVLYWGVAGLTGSATYFICFRVLQPRLTRPLAMVAAIGIGAVAFIVAEKFLSR
jgi:hypothetical protein